jgi:hypothetical protein
MNNLAALMLYNKNWIHLMLNYCGFSLKVCELFWANEKAIV